MATVLRKSTFLVFLVLAVDANRCDEETLLKQRWARLGSLVPFCASRNAMNHLQPLAKNSATPSARLRGERNHTSLNPLGLELSDGKLDFLAEDNASYTAQEAGVFLNCQALSSLRMLDA